MGFALLTLNFCCAYRTFEPRWENAIFGIGGKFLAIHPFKQVIETHAFNWVRPFSLCIDLCVRLDSRDNCVRRNLDVADSFDDFFQRSTKVSLPFSEEPGGVSVPID